MLKNLSRKCVKLDISYQFVNDCEVNADFIVERKFKFPNGKANCKQDWLSIPYIIEPVSMVDKLNFKQ